MAKVEEIYTLIIKALMSCINNRLDIECTLPKEEKEKHELFLWIIAILIQNTLVSNINDKVYIRIVIKVGYESEEKIILEAGNYQYRSKYVKGDEFYKVMEAVGDDLITLAKETKEKKCTFWVDYLIRGNTSEIIIDVFKKE